MCQYLPIEYRLREWLRNLAVEHGPRPAARRVGLSPGTFAAAAAGFPVSNGTHAIVELRHLDAETREVFRKDVA